MQIGYAAILWTQTKYLLWKEVNKKYFRLVTMHVGRQSKGNNLHDTRNWIMPPREFARYSYNAVNTSVCVCVFSVMDWPCYKLFCSVNLYTCLNVIFALVFFLFLFACLLCCWRLTWVRVLPSFDTGANPCVFIYKHYQKAMIKILPKTEKCSCVLLFFFIGIFIHSELKAETLFSLYRPILETKSYVKN